MLSPIVARRLFLTPVQREIEYIEENIREAARSGYKTSYKVTNLVSESQDHLDELLNILVDAGYGIDAHATKEKVVRDQKYVFWKIVTLDISWNK